MDTWIWSLISEIIILNCFKLIVGDNISIYVSMQKIEIAKPIH